MTCKDCIHYEVCKIWNNNIPSEYEGIEFRCDCFKMNNYKELVKNLREEADAVQAIDWSQVENWHENDSILLIGG